MQALSEGRKWRCRWTRGVDSDVRERVKAGAVAGNERSQRSCRRPLMEVADPGRSAGGRKRGRTVAVVPEAPDQSKGTGCENEGAFTPTNSPSTRTVSGRRKAGAPRGSAAIHGGSCFSPFRIGDQEFVQDQYQEGRLWLFLSVSCVHMFHVIHACKKYKKSRQG